MDGAEMAGQTADTFSLNNIQPDNNGKKLKCEATNGVGSGHVEHTLVVFCKYAYFAMLQGIS